MTRRKHKQSTIKAKTGNMMLSGAGASSFQDRGSLQGGAVYSRNPYFNQDFFRRWQDWARWYYTDWAARKVVDIPINDGFRIRPEFKGLNADMAKALEKYDEGMGARDKQRRAATQERLLGGSAILFGIKDQDDNTETPLDVSSIDKGDLAFMNVISIDRISRVDFNNDPFSPMYDTPEFYTINGQKVHVSRLIIWNGNPLFSRSSMNIVQNFRYNPAGFGESVLSPLFDSLVRFTGTQEGAYHLVNLASVLLVKCDKLLELQATNMGDRAINALNRLAEQISIYRAGVLQGKDMEITQHSATFGSVPELLLTFAQILAAGSDIPATRFMGQSPAGLNSTGESDLENYYNNIGSWQNTRLKARDLQMYNILGPSCFGKAEWDKVKDNFDLEYKPLWNLSEVEQAQVDNTYATMAIQLSDAGHITKEAANEELKARNIFKTEIKEEDIPDLNDVAGLGDMLDEEQSNEAMSRLESLDDPTSEV